MRKLRPAKITYERIKVSVLLLGYLALAEWADPRPFAKSPVARLIVFLLIVEVIRQWLAWSTEVSEKQVERAESVRDRWRDWWDRTSADVRHRLRRIVTLLVGFWLFGWIVDGATSRCEGALQCAALFPKIVIENVPTIIEVAFYIAIGMVQLGAMFYAMTKVGSYKLVLPGTVDVTFDDVWGQDQAKARVQEQVALLESSDEVESAGGYMPKGVLLWGPPGTGKTMLAKAAANASTKPLILVPPGSFASTFVGINFLKVWSLFRSIRKLAVRYGGVIVFIDEIDSLGSRGATLADDRPEPHGCVFWSDVHPAVMGNFSGANPGTLEAFLAAMDGMEEPRGLVNRVLRFLGMRPLPPPKYRYMMIGATNAPDRLDPALTRAGRFGRKIHLPVPNFEGRLRTFQGYLGRIEHALTDDEVATLARRMSKGTGAEIEDAVNEALLVAYRDPDRESRLVTASDILNAVLWRQFGESDGRQEHPDDTWWTAVHEAAHAVVMVELLSEYEGIFFGTVERRGKALGMIAPYDVIERPKRSRSILLGRIAVSLAASVAEEEFFGEASNGRGGDGPAATDLARTMVRVYGLGSALQVYGRAAGQDAAEAFDPRVEEVMQEARALAEEVIRRRRDGVQRVAELLRDRGTVLGSDIEEVLS